MIPDNSRLVTVWCIDVAGRIWYHLRMTFYYVLTALEEDFLTTTASTYSQITTALQGIQIPGGQWLGPGPRIVRSISFSGLYHETNVTWAFSLDGPADQAAADQAAAQLISLAQPSLQAVSSNFNTPTVTTLNPSVNGTPEWWTSGQAAATQTMDQFPWPWSPNENPLGPSTPQTTLPTVGQTIGTELNQAGAPTGTQTLSFLTTAMYFAAGGVLLYFAWPLLSGARSAASAATEAAEAASKGSKSIGSAPTQRRSQRQSQLATQARNNPRHRRTKKPNAFSTRDPITRLIIGS